MALKYLLDKQYKTDVSELHGFLVVKPFRSHAYSVASTSCKAAVESIVSEVMTSLL